MPVGNVDHGNRVRPCPRLETQGEPEDERRPWCSTPPIPARGAAIAASAIAVPWLIPSEILGKHAARVPTLGLGWESSASGGVEDNCWMGC